MPFKPGVSGNPKGKPKQKIRLASDDGYSLEDMRNTMKNLFGMSLEDVRKYHKTCETSLEKIICGLIVDSAIDKNYGELNMFWSWCFGKLKEHHEVTNVASDTHFITMPNGELFYY